MIEFLKNRDLFLWALLGILLLSGIGLFALYREARHSDTAEMRIQFQTLPAEMWKRFSSHEGKFSIMFPGIPVTTNLPVNVSTGTNAGHLFYVNYTPVNSFAIEYEDSAKFMGPDVKKSPQEFLQKTENLSIPEGPAKIVFEQESTFDGYPAREFEYAVGGKGNYSVRYKMILAGGRFYVLYVIFLTANPHPADRAIFFNSLSLN